MGDAHEQISLLRPSPELAMGTILQEGSSESQGLTTPNISFEASGPSLNLSVRAGPQTND